MKMNFFELAKKLSYKSDYPPHKLGAVVVRKNSIVGIGFNKTKTHPKAKTRFKTIHAEMAAILNCQQEDLSGCSIYVYRETKDKQLALAKPCECCLELIRQVGIKDIYYTDTDGFKYERISLF